MFLFILFAFRIAHRIGWLCFIETIYNIFNTTLNRSLPVAIAAYRYIYVCHWELVFTDRQKKRVNIFLTVLLFFWPVCSTAGVFFYIGNTRRFNVCMGMEEQFYYDFQDIFYQKLGTRLKYIQTCLVRIF